MIRNLLVCLSGLLLLCGCQPEVPERFTNIGNAAFGTPAAFEGESGFLEDKDHGLFLLLRQTPLSKKVWQITVILRDLPENSDPETEAKKLAAEKFHLKFSSKNIIELPGTRIEIARAFEYGPAGVQIIFTDREYEQLFSRENNSPETIRQRDVMRAKNDILILEKAIYEYRDETGSFPEKLEDLLISPGVSGWQGPYLPEKSIPSDPWKRKYIYRRTNSGFELFSTGINGQEHLR